MRVIVPNIWPGILAAAFISVALVLGEFTISSLLHYDTLPVVIVLLGKSDAPESMAAALALDRVRRSRCCCALSLLDRRRRRRPKGSSDLTPTEHPRTATAGSPSS